MASPVKIAAQPIGESPPAVLRSLGTADLLIATCGYEARSRVLASRTFETIPEVVAPAYAVEHVHSYSANRAFFRQIGAEVEVIESSDFYPYVKSRMDAAAGPTGEAQVAVDVSSMDRSRIAHIVLAAHDRALDGHGTILDVAYIPAQFQPPPAAEEPIAVTEPVVERLAGWTLDADLPVSVVVGLGYEPNKAISAVEYLDGSRTWIFTPTGVDERYDIAVERENSALSAIEPPEAVLEYDVLKPTTALQQLTSLLGLLTTSSRPVLVPFGPKMFTAVCCVAAVQYLPLAAVWRFSSTGLSLPVDRRPAASVSSMRVQFAPAVGAL